MTSHSSATIFESDRPAAGQAPGSTIGSPASLSALASVFGRQVWVAIRFLIAMTVVTGILYPLAVLGLGQLVARHQANGSLITDSSGKVVGSALIGQQFDGDKWFIGRPSAAGKGYDAMSSSGTNLSADSPVLLKAIDDSRAEIAKSDGVDPSQVPADAVTSSASGLDPNISPAYARIQISRVAKARNLPVDRVAALVSEHTEGRILGFIGEQRVNVLQLNLALSALS